MRERKRQRIHYAIAGTTTVIASGETYRYSFPEDERYMTDFVEKQKRRPLGLLPPSNCDIDHIERVPPRLSGRNGFWKHSEAPILPYYYPETPNYLERYQRVDANILYATRLLAQTHPFRPEFSIPTAIAEMLDIGTLFKLTAKSFAELAGNSYLQYKFGYVQFVNDVKTLASITTAIERRVKEFTSLGLKGGLRRSVDLDGNSWHQSGNTGIIWSTYGAYIIGTYNLDESVKITGSVRWKWKDGVTVSLSKLEAFNLAVKTVFDLGELDASTIWNSIPWTWLADYFVDIGSWLQANENSDLVEPYDICIMWHHKSHTQISPELLFPVESYHVKKGTFIRHRYARDWIPGVPTLPPVRYSFLSKSQVLVLLSLYGKFRGSTY